MQQLLHNKNYAHLTPGHIHATLYRFFNPQWTFQSTRTHCEDLFLTRGEGERDRTGRGSCPAMGRKATREELGDSDIAHFQALVQQHPLKWSPSA